MNLRVSEADLADSLTGSTDVAVPFSRLADIIEVSKKEMDDLGLFASILGHVGDGNFHESIMYDNSKPGEREKVEACVKNMVKRALDMEGTCTGEHSIGWGKKESLLWEVGPETLAVMKALKGALDPRWVMNPGKIMDVPWMEERYPGADTAVIPNRAFPLSRRETVKEVVKQDWPVGLGDAAVQREDALRGGKRDGQTGV